MNKAQIKGLTRSIIIVIITVSFSCRKEDSYRGESNPPPKIASITFQKRYGGTNTEAAFDVRQTKDSGYIIIGTTTSFGAGDYDMYIVKTDARGTMLWTKTLGGAGADDGDYIKQTADGGYILGGGSGSFGSYNLIKTSASGNVQWSKVYDGFRATDAQQAGDGGYIVAGSSAASAGIQLIKTDGNGNIAWSKTYRGGNAGVLAQTKDGGYAIAGRTGIFGSGDWDFLFLKTDTNGNLLWTKTYGGIAIEDPHSMQQTSDGGYIIAGWTNSFGAGDFDAYLVKIDANGKLLWSKTYGGSSYDGAMSVAQTKDGQYILSGIVGGRFGYGRVLLIKTDNNGNTIWSKTFGEGGEGYSFAHQTKDEGYIIASATWSFGATYGDIYLIKTDSTGKSGCHERSFIPTVTTPPTLVTSPAPIVSSGGTSFTPSFYVGTGGTELTLCYK